MSRAINQPAPIPDHDSWQCDPSARWWHDHLLGQQPDPVASHMSRIGRAVGSELMRAAADRANRMEPRLQTWDRYGHRIDEVEHDPTWHELIDQFTASGVCGLPWLDPDHGYLRRAFALEQWARLDIGVMCPVTMTAAAMPVLLAAPDAAAASLADGILDASRDGLEGANPAERRWSGRGGAHPLIGMAMTEPQGGSDLSAPSTIAHARDDGTYRLTGHKWFVSHPTVDALLTLAREPGLAADGSRGLSCFLVPGWLPDGARNGIQLQRLKDKLGTRSLASAEVLLADAVGTRIGEPGRGIATIMQMVVHTRMDCSLGNAGVLARAVGEAVHHARVRRAFGAPLVEQPLMRMVLADLLLEREASFALALEVARGFQAADPVTRLVTAVAKYWITRRAVAGCIECVEVLGGNGYTEEFPLARLYRDAQVNSTWEGSGNVMALDVLRAIGTDHSLVTDTRARIAQLVNDAPDDLAAAIAAFTASIEMPLGEQDARRFAARIALALQAGLLAHRAGASGEQADTDIARAFVATRLVSSPERVFGDGGADLAAAAEPLLHRAPGPAD